MSIVSNLIITQFHLKHNLLSMDPRDGIIIRLICTTGIQNFMPLSVSLVLRTGFVFRNTVLPCHRT